MLVGQEDTAGCGNDPRSIQALLPITYRQRHVDCGQSYSGKLGTRHRTRPAQCQVGGSVGKIHAIHIVNAVITPCVTLDEVSALADRIAVMYRGTVVGIVPGDTPRDTLGLMMAGETEPEVAA